MAEVNIPEDLKYTKSHEWIKIEGNIITIGITDFAQQELSDIVYVEFQLDTDDEISQGDPFCTIEAVKTAEDINSPADGKIISVNSDLPDDPSVINKDPYGQGWLAKIEVADQSFQDNLISAQEYLKITEQSSH
ncbi:MAG: glycine cleavage system protein H [Desulfuromonas sp. SDB]|nr:MAG: glycine cleavage system protein H [Desulfuromonas sp. SDB]